MKTEYEKNEEKEERSKKRRKIGVRAMLITIVLILIALTIHSCHARDEPLPQPTEEERTYEADVEPQIEKEETTPSESNKRINLAISDSYVISDEKPVFYIGYPEENIFDIKLTFLADAQEILKETNYVAPGTNVEIDGTSFLEKGKHKVNCLISIYDHDTGEEISSCTTLVLNITYE